MAEAVNVRVSGRLRRFIEERSAPGGLYESASEYIRDLVRRDYEREERRRWARLLGELQPGMTADEGGFVDFDPDVILAAARTEHADDAP